MKYIILLNALLFCGIVSAKSLTVGITKKEISCFGKKDGQFELSIMGGKAPYTIECNGKIVESVISDLAAGEYQIIVKDSKGEIKTINSSLVAPSPLTINYGAKTETIVDGLSGSIDVKFSGGTPWQVDGLGYFVRLDGQANIQDPLSIGNGIHHLEIEDASGCKLGVKVNLIVDVVYNGVSVVQSEAPVQPTYNGHGNVKLTIYKNSTFTLNNSTSSGSVQQ